MNRISKLSVLALALGGCRTEPAVRSERSGEPAPYVVFVSLPRSLEQSSGAQSPEALEKGLALDRERMGEALRQACERTGACSRLEVVKSSGQDALEAAREGRADILIQIDPASRPRYRFLRRNLSFLPNTLLWFIGGLPSFWVKDRVYELRWDVDFKVLGVLSAKDLGTLRNTLHEERALHLADRGWTASALYTPPGLYEGPRTSETLAPRVEEWLVDAVLRFLETETRTPRLPVDIEVSISSPRNLKTLPPGPVRLRARIISPTPLEEVRIQLDGREVRDLNPDNMPGSTPIPAAGSGEPRYGYEIDLPVECHDPGANEIRIVARQSGLSSVGDVLLPGARSGVSKTVRVFVGVE